MPKGYHHLTYAQRCQIGVLLARNTSYTQIAKALGVHRSTISREVESNNGPRQYQIESAHKRARNRRKIASRRPRKMTPDIIVLIEEKLCLQWSPEQIAGWMRAHHPTQAVSHELIYQHVWKDKKQEGSLYKNLRHRGKKYNTRRGGKAGRGLIPNRVGIEHRPAVVEEKIRVGDWELDTVVGPQGTKGAIVSMVDRFSKFAHLVKIHSRTAAEVTAALVKKLGSLGEAVYTLTADNGKEFSQHAVVSQILDAPFYFANPYHSWERGLNEHTNGLLRQYLPKGQELSSISQEKLDEIAHLLNNRPRKSLNFSTPIEVVLRSLKNCRQPNSLSEPRCCTS